jgi:hypothetical protein
MHIHATSPALASASPANPAKGDAVNVIPEHAEHEDVEPKEILIELLGSEMEEYGAPLALLEEQQGAIVERAPERVFEINTSINDQMRMIQVRRETREQFVSNLAKQACRRVETRGSRLFARS